MSGGCSSATEAPARYVVQVNARGPHPTRQLSDRFLEVVMAKCDRVNVDVVAFDDWADARCKAF